MKDLPNIFLIVFDTLRRDILPIYGGRSRMPSLESFSKDAVVYGNAIAPSPWTVPSHMSFFTGMYPGEHGVHEDNVDGFVSAADSIRNYNGFNLMEYLKKTGYITAGISANPMLFPGSGIDSFFSQFTLIPSDYNFSFKTDEVKTFKQYDENLYRAAIKMLTRGKISELRDLYRSYRYIKDLWKVTGFPRKKGSDILFNLVMNSSLEEPFFYFLNLYDVHEPVCQYDLYNTPLLELQDLIGIKRFSENQINEIRSSYVRSAESQDEEFGKFITHLKKIGLYDDSLIILVSDHGQSLKERYGEISYYGHGNFLFDELVRVPLIIKYPGNAKPGIKEGYQSLTDIPGMIKEWIEASTPSDISRETAFSETWGYTNNVANMMKEYPVLRNVDFDEFRDKYGYMKKAVYKNGYKLVVDGTHGRIVEFKKGEKNADIADSRSIVLDMVEDLYIFKGNEKFVLPDIESS